MATSGSEAYNARKKGHTKQVSDSVAIAETMLHMMSKTALTSIKAIASNFYVSVNIRFTQATTRGDDTTLIQPFGSSNTSRYFSVFVLFVFGVLGRHSRAGAQEVTRSTRFYQTTRREGGGERC